MGFLSWIILGLIAGVLAKWIMPGKDGGGFIITTILGVVGAFVGGYLGTLIGVATGGGLSLGGIATATAGAIVVLFIYRMVAK